MYAVESATTDYLPPTPEMARAALDGKSTCAPIELEFIRNPDQSFTAITRLRDTQQEGCPVLTDVVPQITGKRGSITSPLAQGEGIYTATVTPDAQKTGEYPITVSASIAGNPKSFTKTALAFDYVDKRWGQPQVVKGLVNTLGWEDSPYITADGEYLFTMYLPISPSCVLEKKNHKAKDCRDLRGKLTAKNRPGFAEKYAGGRIKESPEDLAWNCLEVGKVYTEDMFNRYEVYTPPMISYGFKRQPDGSFAEPFPVAVEGVSACVAPSGLEVHVRKNGPAIALMGLVDPRSWNTKSEKDYPDLFTAEIKLGQPNTIATWNPGEKKLESPTAKLRLIFGKPMKGRQDNPHGVENPETGQIDLVFWDSEHNDEDTFYRFLEKGGSFPDGPWSDVRKTPVFSEKHVMEIQPFFDGKVLTVTRRYDLASRDFLGDSWEDLADVNAWGPERIELAVDDRLEGDETGVLHAVGDATYAHRNGRTLLYFVYMTRRSDGNLDFNIGFVEGK